MCNGNQVSAQKLGNHDVSQETTASRMWLVLSPGLAGETQRHMACLFQLLAASPPPPSLCSLPRLLGLWSLAPRCFQFLLQHRAALPGADWPWSPSAATYVVTSVTEWAIQVLAVCGQQQPNMLLGASITVTSASRANKGCAQWY